MNKLQDVLSVLEAWCGRPLTDGQRTVYSQALIGYPVETVADVLVAWQKRNAPGSRLPPPSDVANACREAVRGTWQQQKDESPRVDDLEKSARTVKSKAALTFIRAMLSPTRTQAARREAARTFRAVYGDYTQSTCYREDCPGNVWRGNSCVAHVRRAIGPWVAMAEESA